MALIVVGLVIVSLQSFLEARSEKNERRRNEKKSDVIVGIVVMVISQFVLACLGI
jgi:uncharacterized membrane protein YidH (DUF202 family)